MSENVQTSAVEDPAITISLPLSAWYGIGASLSQRPYGEVAAYLQAISAQLVPQVEAAAIRVAAADAAGAQPAQQERMQ